MQASDGWRTNVPRTQAKIGSFSVVSISSIIGFVAASLYFSYHGPGATEVALQEDVGLTASQVGLLFTTYSTPNLVMPVLVGLAIDRLGLKKTGVALLATLGLGSVIYALAFHLCESLSMMFLVMNVGRFVQGLAGECLVTWQQSACLFWFSGVHLSKSMGTALAVQNGLGSASSFFVLEWARESFGLAMANWVVVLFCVASFLMMLVVMLLERCYVSHLIWEQKREVYLYPFLLGFCAKPDRIKCPEPLSEDPAASDVPTLSLRQTLFSFPLSFWLENVVIFFTITVLYTSANFFPELLVSHYSLSRSEAALCSSLLYVAMLFAPLAGAIVDMCGRRMLVQLLSMIGALLGFAALYWTDISPWVMVPLIGWFYSWAEQNSYSLLGDTFAKMTGDATGVGFGIMGLFLNAGLMIVPPLVGLLGDMFGAREQLLLYCGFMLFGVVMSIVMWAVDKDGVLNRSGPTEARAPSFASAGNSAANILMPQGREAEQIQMR